MVSESLSRSLNQCLGLGCETLSFRLNTQVLRQLFHLILQFSSETCAWQFLKGTASFVTTPHFWFQTVGDIPTHYGIFSVCPSSSLPERASFSRRFYHFPRCKIFQGLMLDFLFILLLSSVPNNTGFYVEFSRLQFVFTSSSSSGHDT